MVVVTPITVVMVKTELRVKWDRSDEVVSRDLEAKKGREEKEVVQDHLENQESKDLKASKANKVDKVKEVNQVTLDHQENLELMVMDQKDLGAHQAQKDVEDNLVKWDLLDLQDVMVSLAVKDLMETMVSPENQDEEVNQVSKVNQVSPLMVKLVHVVHQANLVEMENQGSMDLMDS